MAGIIGIIVNIILMIHGYIVKHIIKNEYMLDGTKFLNNSYQKIVREEVLNDLNELNSSNVLIIYGTKDTMVEPYRVYNEVNKKIQTKMHFIEDGTHDIANTNPDEIISLLDIYLTK